MYRIMNKAINYIEDNLCDDVTLDDISFISSYSKTHISRMFNRIVGISLSEYISKRRLAKAALMLKSSKKSIEYISDIFGFGSSKYFSTVFKKEYGISPSIYRNKKNYIYLYPKRIIKGGIDMNMRNKTELVEFIQVNSGTQDELLDTLSTLDNVELYSQENSEVKLISIIEKDANDILIQLEMNLISGKHYIRPIFSTFNSPGVKMKSLQKDADSIEVVFASVGKTLTASIFPVGDTDFEVMVETNIKKVFDYSLDKEFPKTHIDVQKFSEKLLGVQNNHELEDIIDSDKSLLKFKSFINEYALIYMTFTEKTLALFSIYIDLENKKYRQINVFTTPNGYQELTFKKEGFNACVYNGSDLLAKAHIYTRDLSPTFALEFPNGSTGTGAWDLTNMFESI